MRNKISKLQYLRGFIGSYRWYKQRGYCHRMAWFLSKNDLYL